ncbi:MAG TPA: filamentous hemagglutinin N-terminal domain-containing protein [Coleofasciculaceae cyanobacterium]
MKRKKAIALLLVGILGGELGGTKPAWAQIAPDETLPQPSVVQRQGNRFVITGGSQAGSANLFHSLRKFSVPRGSTASFQGIDPALNNVFVRVTGASVSQIDGLVELRQRNGSISAANLFLLNPNGILFGPNAALNLGGSFLATTANWIDFADGDRFSAVDPQASALLTVSLPVGLQIGGAGRSGRIVSQSIAPYRNSTGQAVEDYFGSRLSGLAVPAGQTLALIGGDVVLSGSGLIAESGRIELGSVAQGQVSLKPLAQGWAIGYGGIQDFGTLQIVGTATQPARVYTSGEGGGRLQLRGDRILLDNAVVLAQTLGSQNGEPLLINASDLQMQGAAFISASTLGSGRGGDVRVQADRITLVAGSRIETNVETGFEAEVAATGAGGNLSIRAGTLLLDDLFSGLFVNAISNGAEQGGNLTIEAERLEVRGGAQINTTSFGTGDAGTLSITATDIDLTGIARDQNGDFIPYEYAGKPTNLPNSSGIYGGTLASGAGGDVVIHTQRLNLSDGASLQTTTFGSGNAGRLQVNATAIQISGSPQGGLFSAGIRSISGDALAPTTGQVATGQGGDIVLNTQTLTVRGNQAQVSSSSLNRSQAVSAGDVSIKAQGVNLDDRALLQTETNSGNGGNLRLQLGSLLTLRRGSTLSTSAGSANAGGNGGSIRIDTPFVVSSLAENSDVTANAFTGNGGNITLNATVIGIAPQQHQTSQSDITAFSQQGISGNITISSLQVDPTQRLAELPETIVDASQLVAQTCRGGTARSLGEFVVTGRGGLPPSPGEARSSQPGGSDWAMLPQQSAEETQTSAQSSSQSFLPIVEAQGWAKDGAGHVSLVAKAAAMTLQQPATTASDCAP